MPRTKPRLLLELHVKIGRGDEGHLADPIVGVAAPGKPLVLAGGGQMLMIRQRAARAAAKPA